MRGIGARRRSGVLQRANCFAAGHATSGPSIYPRPCWQACRAVPITRNLGDAATVRLDRRFPVLVSAGMLEFVPDPVPCLQTRPVTRRPAHASSFWFPGQMSSATSIGGFTELMASAFICSIEPGSRRLRLDPAGACRRRSACYRSRLPFDFIARDGKRRILFLVNGLGLGNSTRCHAVMQRLIEHGAEIQVVTSGNGLWYFQSVSGHRTVA